MKTMITSISRCIKTIAVAGCLALAIVGLVGASAVYAQNPDPEGDYNPYVSSGIIGTTAGVPSTLLPVEFNGTGVFSFKVGNTGSDSIVVVPNQEMGLVITLNRGVPDNVDPLAALGGDGAAMFSWIYLSDVNTYRGTQIQTFGPDSEHTITIAYRVTVNSPSTNLQNGANVNVQPPPYTNISNTTDDDSVSSYTYVQAFDYGDAPISYGEAGHEVDVTRNTTTGLYNFYIYMGAVVDPEFEYQASADARGDDNNQTGGLGVDDEDGVTFPEMRRGESVTIPVVVTLTAPGQFGFLNAWIDWNGDGVFGAGEQIASDQIAFASGTVSLNITVPADAVIDRPTFARFRFGPPGLGPTGFATYGEVEDYQIQILIPSAVLLADFSAVSEPDHILVTWQTFSEFDNAGFNLYRALAVDGERTLLGWVPSATPGGTTGADYSYQDFDVVGGQTYWYWLEDVDLFGVATLHGPVNAVQAPMVGPKLFLPLIIK